MMRDRSWHWRRRRPCRGRRLRRQRRDRPRHRRRPRRRRPWRPQPLRARRRARPRRRPRRPAPPRATRPASTARSSRSSPRSTCPRWAVRARARSTSSSGPATRRAARTIPDYDWVTPFEQETGCKVNDQGRQHLRRDGHAHPPGRRRHLRRRVAPPATRRCRLIANGDVAAIDPTTIPGFGDVCAVPPERAPLHRQRPALRRAPRLGRQHAAVPDRHRDPGARRAGTSCSTRPRRSPTRARSPTTTARSTSPTPPLYLKAHKPGARHHRPVRARRRTSSTPRSNLLKTQQPWVGKYWSLFSDEIDNFKNGTTVVGTTWPYQYNALKAREASRWARSSRPRA